MEENKKQSFLMYYEYEENLKTLTDEQLGRLLRAIFKYEKLGLEPENLGSLELMAFNFIKGNLNRDRQKYDKRSETSAINGKRGGRPSKKKPNEKPNQKPNKPKKADNDNENEIDNEYENDNEIVIDNDNELNMLEFVEQNFERTLTPIEIQKIEEWRETFTEDILKYAVKKAVLQKIKTFAYVDGILKNWQGCNYKTLQEILDVEKKRKEKKEEKVELFDYDWLNNEN